MDTKLIEITAPFESIEFSPHEWKTVVKSIKISLMIDMQGKGKYERFRIDMKMFKVIKIQKCPKKK